MPSDLAFLVGLRQRIRLPQYDLGPRAVVLLGRKAYVANYFSDSLSLVDLSSPEPRPSPSRFSASPPEPAPRGPLLRSTACP